MSTESTSKPKLDRIISSLTKAGMLPARDLVELGISREYLRKLSQRGLLENVGHGLYRLPHGEISAFHSIAEAGVRFPNGVICLLSALRLHWVTTQSPSDVWVAIESGAWKPRSPYLSVRFIRPSGPAFHEGVELREIEGVTVRVYSLAKTVADCFKYRNKVGLDVALEGLRESLRNKSVSSDDIWRYAKICRVANVMRPYLEAMD
jgi:predicted transcriptional regulator of viral defense system